MTDNTISITESNNTITITQVVNTISIYDGPVPAPSYETPSYDNTGGTGDRTGIITVTATTGLFATGNPEIMVNGNTTETIGYFADVAGAGKFVKFAFAAAKLITEVKWYSSGGVTYAVCQWAGSNDDSNWTDIGSTFTLGPSGSSPQTQTELSGNTTGYKYYRLMAISGNFNSGGWQQETQFKIGNQL